MTVPTHPYTKTQLWELFRFGFSRTPDPNPTLTLTLVSQDQPPCRGEYGEPEL